MNTKPKDAAQELAKAVLEWDAKWGPVTKGDDCFVYGEDTDQISLAGNSVCPPVAQALVAAQVRGAEVRAA